MILEEMLCCTPPSPEHAANHVQLLELWREGRKTLEYGAADEPIFQDWDARVQKLLDPAELEFYLSSYGNLDLRYLDYRAVSRMKHLTKILVYHQGIGGFD